MADKFLIAPFKSGLVKNAPVWQTPEDSFSELNNAYVHRGVIKKRFGSKYIGTGAKTELLAQLKSRLRIDLPSDSVKVGTTNGGGDLSGTVAAASGQLGQKFVIGAEVCTVINDTTGPQAMATTGTSTTHTFDVSNGNYVFVGAPGTTDVYFYDHGIGTTDGLGNASGVVPGTIFKDGQLFSIGDEIFTVPELDTPVDMLRTGPNTDVCTYDTTTGTYFFTNVTPATQIYFYPAQPVMGLTMFEAGAINNHTAIAFDTQFAYLYSGSGFSRSGTQTYTGDNLNYFWCANYEGTNPQDTALFATNFKCDAASSDNMYYTLDKTTWTAFKPKFLVAGTGDENIVVSCRAIAGFKSHLLLGGTYEYENKSGAYAYKSFDNRLRYSAVKNPLGPVSFLEAKEVGYVGGGYIDAPTKEALMSFQYVRDRMIVFFERSTYELVYTFNSVLPFVFQKISSDLGSESTFSNIPSEYGTITIGSTGVHICNGASVKRIDTKIPDEIFKFLNVSTAVQRIHGIKDYDSEVFYWTIPNQQANDTDAYPDTILVYNYENDTWALYDDCLTCFGYFEQTLSDTWEEDYQAWEDDDTSWDSAEEVQNHRHIIAGNQQGFVVGLSNGTNSNAPILQVSKISGSNLTIKDHNLVPDSYIELHNTGIAAQDIILPIFSVIDKDTISTLVTSVPSYLGGATVSRVSQISIKSTAWNPYLKQGSNVSLLKITFGVVRTESGEITVNFIPSQSNIDAISDSQATGANLGTYILETYPYDLVPLEKTQALLWHTVYFQAEGNSVQIYLTWTEDQMTNKSIMQSNFEIQGIILETSPSGMVG